MKRNAIFVGGTGQNILLGFLHTVNLFKYLKHFESFWTDKPEIFIFDADLKGVEKSITTEINTKFGGFLNINEIKPYPADLEKVAGSFKFGGFLSGTGLADEIKKALYESYQLKLDIHNGFYGEPSIGAPIIASKIKEISSKTKGFENPYDEHLRRVIEDVNESLFVLSGSVFGGTGAAGIPSLAKLIKDIGGDRRRIRALLHTKWYRISNVKGDSPITDPKLEINGYSGLMYGIDYAAMRENFELIVLMGLREEAEYKYEGPDSQSAKIDPVHFVSALGVYRLLDNKLKMEGNRLAYIASNGKFTLLDFGLNNWLSEGKLYLRSSSEKYSVGFLISVNYLAEIYLLWLIQQIETGAYKASIFRENLFPDPMDKLLFGLQKKGELRPLAEELRKRAEGIHMTLGYLDTVYKVSWRWPYDNYFNFDLIISGEKISDFVPFQHSSPDISEVIDKSWKFFMDKRLLGEDLENFTRKIFRNFNINIAQEEIADEILKAIFNSIFDELDTSKVKGPNPEEIETFKSIQLIKGDEWNIAEPGEIKYVNGSEDLRNNGVLNSERIHKYGIPNIWASAIYVKYIMEKGESGPLKEIADFLKDKQLLYLRGIFSGILVPERVKLSDLGRVGEFLDLLYLERGKEALNNGLVILRDRETNEIVSYWYPGYVFVPAAFFSSFADRIKPDPKELCRDSQLEQNLKNRIDEFFSNNPEVENYFIAFSREISKGISGTLLESSIPRELRDKEIDEIYTSNFSDTVEELPEIPIVVDSSLIKKPLYAFVPEVVKELPKNEIENYKDIESKYSLEDLAEVGIFWDERAERFYIFSSDEWKGKTLKGFFTKVIGKEEVKFKGYAGRELVIKGKVIDFGDIVCKRVLWIKPASGRLTFLGKNQLKEVVPDIPVLSEYIGLISDARVIKKKAVNKDKGTLQYEIDLKNCSETRKVEIEAHITDKYLPWLKLWPNFRSAEDWKIYYLWYSQIGAETYKLKVFAENDEKVYLMTEDKIQRLKSLPSYVVFSNDKDEEMGIVRLPIEDYLEQVAPQDSEVIAGLSIDFGTSNSCAAYSADGEAHEGPAMVQFSDHSLSIYAPPQGIIRESYDVSFNAAIPTLDFPSKISVLPSELFIKSQPGDSWEKGFESWAIMNPQKLPDIADNKMWEQFKQYFMQRNRILYRIKWSKDAEKIRKYLYVFLSLVFAELHSLGFKEIKNILLTYPLSFSKEHLKALIDAYADVLKKLSEETGIVIDKAYLVNESIAAINFLPKAEGGVAKLAMDLGGGSLDICYLLGDKIYIQESLRLGGEDFVEAIIPKEDDRTTASYAIKKGIDAGQVLKAYRADQGKLIDGKKILSEFLRRLLNSAHLKYSKQENIDPNADISLPGIEGLEIHLLGNGWKLEMKENAEDLLKTNVHPNDIGKIDFVRHRNPKESVVKGAINLFSTKEDSIAGSNMEDLDAQVLLDSVRRIEGLGSRSFVGIDEVVVGDEVLEWYREIPCTVGGKGVMVKKIQLSRILENILATYGDDTKNFDMFIRKVNSKLVSICSNDIEQLGENTLVVSPWKRFIESYIAPLWKVGQRKGS